MYLYGTDKITGLLSYINFFYIDKCQGSKYWNWYANKVFVLAASTYLIDKIFLGLASSVNSLFWELLQIKT